MNHQAPEIERLITEYLAAWNAPNSEARALLIDKVLAANCIYADSHLPQLIETRELHSSFIDQFKSKFPELKISLVATPDIHHGFFRFRWQLAQPNGDIFTQGIFFGEINQDNQITKLVGFVDE